MAIVVFAIALCRAAARADATESHQCGERHGWSERAVRSAMPTAPSFAWEEGHNPVLGERRAKATSVFLVDEQGDGEKPIKLKLTTSRSRAAWSLGLWGAGGDHRRLRRQGR
ncbi:MAG: hypothetical protein ABSB69_08775 [Solirubrobacteraceae bacterium]